MEDEVLEETDEDCGQRARPLATLDAISIKWNAICTQILWYVQLLNRSCLTSL